MAGPGDRTGIPRLIGNLVGRRDPRIDRAPHLNHITAAYGQRVRRFGPSAQGVCWADQDGQALRFELLLRIVAPEDARDGFTLNDYGCGYGAFFEYLDADPGLNPTAFVGYDMCPEMVHAARARAQDPRARFVYADKISRTADYTFASGTFNLLLGSDPLGWNHYVKAGLEHLWSRSAKGLAFNMLDHQTPDQMDGLYYADPQEFVDFCAEYLSPDVELIPEDSIPDWTILVRR